MRKLLILALLLGSASLGFAAGGACTGVPVPSGITSCFFVDSVNGLDTNNGENYHLNSGSPAANFFAAGTNILPYDISGQIRNNVGYGSAGAFEQAIVQTTGGVFSF